MIEDLHPRLTTKIETIELMTSMSESITTGFLPGTTHRRALGTIQLPGTTPLIAGTTIGTMIPGIATMTRGTVTMRIGTLLPPGPTMTDPQPPEGTTRTPETSKGMTDALPIAAERGVGAQVHLQRPGGYLVHLLLRGEPTEGVLKKKKKTLFASLEISCQ